MEIGEGIGGEEGRRRENNSTLYYYDGATSAHKTQKISNFLNLHISFVAFENKEN